MDMAPDAAELQRIDELIAQSGTGSIEVHDLRARQAGRLTFVDFHLVVPGEMTVTESHAICDRIESTLKTDMAHLAITIHVEPEEKAKLHQALTISGRPAVPAVPRLSSRSVSRRCSGGSCVFVVRTDRVAGASNGWFSAGLLTGRTYR